MYSIRALIPLRLTSFDSKCLHGKGNTRCLFEGSVSDVQLDRFFSLRRRAANKTAERLRIYGRHVIFAEHSLESLAIRVRDHGLSECSRKNFTIRSEVLGGYSWPPA
jgi:hypothetical protein